MTTTMLQASGPVEEILLGTLGARINLRGYDGVDREPRGNAATAVGAALSSANYGLIEQTTHGKHIAVPLAATAVTAAPTPANSVLLVDDDGLLIGAGKDLKLYNAAGTFAVSLNGTAATGNRVVTFPDVSDTVAMLGRSQTFTGSNTFSNTTTFLSAVTATSSVAAGTAFLPGGQTSTAYGLYWGQLTASGGAGGAAGATAALSAFPVNAYGLLHLVDTTSGGHMFADVGPVAVNAGGASVKNIGAVFDATGTDVGAIWAVYLVAGVVTVRNRRADGASNRQIRWQFWGGA